MPMESRVGTKMPWMMESPMPASGPMRAVFTEVGISSGMGSPKAMPSSMDATMPLMMVPT